jgi:enamine deaminase RidA (YjgF/YER057c/UK114 family)
VAVHRGSLTGLRKRWVSSPSAGFCSCQKLTIIREETCSLLAPFQEELMTRPTRTHLVVAVASLACTLSASALAKECYAPDARSQERAFSRAVITEGGKTVWLGGQTGSPEKNFEGQARDIFAELDKTIKAVGGAGLRDVVTMTVFINDVRLGDRLTEIRKEIFKDCFPGSALITVTGFARPGILIEIQGMAVIGGK